MKPVPIPGLPSPDDGRTPFERFAEVTRRIISAPKAKVDELDAAEKRAKAERKPKA